MIGYWFYKFKVEDRDIGVVDYESLEISDYNLFPVVSFCFSDIFLPDAFPSNDSKIDKSQYLSYLNGELYDEAYENINYWNVTFDLEDYFLYGQVSWSNESGYRNDTLAFLTTRAH